MNKSINSKYLVTAAAVMLALGVIATMPNAVFGYYDPNIGTPYSYSNSYSTPSTVYVRQPVYIQQPVVYVQPTPVVVQTPVYIAQPVYNSLRVSCSANVYQNSTNNSVTAVTWNAYASGGNGVYSYSWYGSDGLTGFGRSVYFNYSNAGQKTASVTVYSNGQSITQSCTPITISQPYYNSYPVYQTVYQPVYTTTPVYVAQVANDLSIGCYVDPTNARVDQPVTWTAEVTGGQVPYSYSWTGSEGLNGTQRSVIKYYSTSGTKSAIVTVTSADGKTGVKACSSALTVAAAYKAPVAKAAVKTVAKAPVVQAVAATPAPVVNLTPAEAGSNLTAASLFSLANVPWGWVAILIIAVLFFTVMYLLFNKQKI